MLRRSNLHGLHRIVPEGGTPHEAWHEPVNLAHGCVLVADVVGDVAADVAIGDVASDTAADAAAGDTAADASADAPENLPPDMGAEIGTASPFAWEMQALKGLAGVLGAFVIGRITVLASEVIASAGGSASAPPTSAALWTALHNAMVKSYPCDLPSTHACAPKMRKTQMAMVAIFATKLGAASSSDADAAIAFDKGWTGDRALKAKLVQIAGTGGIPSMIQYMETFTDPGASGATLVIATAPTLLEVAAFEYTD